MVDTPARTPDHPSAELRETPVVAIAKALAERRGVDPTDLPPLNDYVDADALNALFRTAGDGTAFGRVTFHVEEYEVHAYHDGRVELNPIGTDTRPAECPSNA
jgi:hypothetical protein